MIGIRRNTAFLLAVSFIFTAGARGALAQEESVKPGINKSYQNTDVQQAVKRFEGEDRDVVKVQDEIIAACRLEPGMTVADLGAGTGLFTRLIAPKVLPGGKVYAVDITEAFVEHVKKTCQEQGIENVVTVVSTPKSAKLAPQSTDLIFTSDVYHHFEYPFEMLESIHAALRPNGRLIVVDRNGPSDHVRAGRETVKKEVTSSGFQLIDETDLTEREYLMHFRKVARAAAGASKPGVSQGGGASLPGRQQTARLEIHVPVSLDYLLFLPENYRQKDSWPLMLFLHGAGERGDDLERVKKHGPPKMVETKNDFPFILVSPQCKPDQWWRPLELTALVDDVVAKYKVDEDRIYVTGLSMGGFGTWSLASQNPKRFAALVPICGGGDSRWARRLSDVPIWVFHGGEDKVVPLERSRAMVDALKERGGNVQFTVYPDAGHDSWTETYDNPKLYDWLLQQKLGGQNAADN